MIGDIVDKIPNTCPSCGEYNGNIEYDNGFPAVFIFDCGLTINLGDIKKIDFECLRNIDKCTCDIMLLMRTGCVCGFLKGKK